MSNGNGIPIIYMLVAFIIIPIISIVLGIVIFTFIFNNAEAQVESTDRFFSKDFCASELTLLDGVNYQNGDELSYDSGGCPVSVKVIHRWNELSAGQQTLITSRLSANGYTDVTNQAVLQHGQ